MTVVHRFRMRLLDVAFESIRKWLVMWVLNMCGRMLPVAFLVLFSEWHVQSVRSNNLTCVQLLVLAQICEFPLYLAVLLYYFTVSILQLLIAAYDDPLIVPNGPDLAFQLVVFRFKILDPLEYLFLWVPLHAYYVLDLTPQLVQVQIQGHRRLLLIWLQVRFDPGRSLIFILLISVAIVWLLKVSGDGKTPLVIEEWGPGWRDSLQLPIIKAWGGLLDGATLKCTSYQGRAVESWRSFLLGFIIILCKWVRLVMTQCRGWNALIYRWSANERLRCFINVSRWLSIFESYPLIFPPYVNEIFQFFPCFILTNHDPLSLIQHLLASPLLRFRLLVNIRVACLHAHGVLFAGSTLRLWPIAFVILRWWRIILKTWGSQLIPTTHMVLWLCENLWLIQGSRFPWSIVLRIQSEMCLLVRQYPRCWIRGIKLWSVLWGAAEAVCTRITLST